MPLLALPTEILSYIIRLALDEPALTRTYESFNLAEAITRRDDCEAWDGHTAKSLALSCRLLYKLSSEEASSEVILPTQQQQESIRSSGLQLKVRRLVLDLGQSDREIEANLQFLASTHNVEHLKLVRLSDLPPSTARLEPLHGILTGLPFLRDLTLDLGDIEEEHEDEYLTLLASQPLPLLEELHVLRIWNPTSNNLNLTNYPQLSHFTLGSVFTVSDLDLRTILAGAPLTLRHLYLAAVNLEKRETLASLISAKLRMQLESLVLEDIPESPPEGPDHMTVRPLGSLHSCGRLQELDLGHMPMKKIDLFELPPSLRRLRLHLNENSQVETLHHLEQLPNLRLIGLGVSVPSADILAYLRQLRSRGRILLEGLVFEKDVWE